MWNRKTKHDVSEKYILKRDEFQNLQNKSPHVLMYAAYKYTESVADEQKTTLLFVKFVKNCEKKPSDFPNACPEGWLVSRTLYFVINPGVTEERANLKLLYHRYIPHQFDLVLIHFVCRDRHRLDA